MTNLWAGTGGGSTRRPLLPDGSFQQKEIQETFEETKEDTTYYAIGSHISLGNLI